MENHHHQPIQLTLTWWILMDVVHYASFNVKRLYRKIPCERQMSKEHMIFIFSIPAYVYISNHF